MNRSSSFNRRNFLASTAALGASGLGVSGLGAAAFGQQIDPYTGQPLQPTSVMVPGAAADAGMAQTDLSASPRHNISSFQAQSWEPYFQNLTNGAILCDLTSRAVHFWSEDGSTYKLYPSSIPVSKDMTRTGRTEIIKKVVGPSWSPTPDMKARNPEWPDFVPPGPDNPLGTHALWLSWQYYRIHGTHDTRKIGRKSSNGCIGLYNEHIKQLYDLTRIGTQVLVM